MLLWCKPNGLGGVLAEFQEAADQVAELGQRFVIGLRGKPFRDRNQTSSRVFSLPPFEFRALLNYIVMRYEADKYQVSFASQRHP